MTTRPKGSRNESFTMSITDAISSSVDEVQCLYDEMQEWQSNMECNSMESMPKYDEVSECVSNLENAEFDQVDPSQASDVCDAISITFTQDTRRSATSRRARLENAMSGLTAARDEIRAQIDNLEELYQALETACDNLEQVDFPGMY